MNTKNLNMMIKSPSFAIGGAGMLLAGAALMLPNAAQAQATCTSGTTITDNNSNAVTIAGGNPNNPGITCSYTGTGAMVATDSATTISTTAPGGGINLSATGSNAINWNSTAGTVTGSTQTQGPVIEAISQTGDINITTGGVTGTAATVSHGIRAASESGGNINITTTGNVSASNSTAGVYAIEAISTGGNGNVSIVTGGTLNGRQRSLVASSTGAGRTSVILNGSVSGGGVEVRSGTGGYYVEVNAGNNNPFLSASGTGNGEIVIGVAARQRSLITDLAAGSVTEVHLIGGLISNTSTPVSHTASGAGELVVNLIGGGDGPGSIRGHINYSALTGNVALNIDSRMNHGGWLMPAGTSVLNAGGATVLVSRTGLIGNTVGDSTLDFGGGSNVFRNEGVIAVGADNGAANLRLEGLGDTGMTNAGLIVLGASTGAPEYPNATRIANFYSGVSDGQINDVFTLRDSRFVAEEGSRIYLDALLEGTTQNGCDSLSAGDCVDLRGTVVEGQTLVRIRDASPSFVGAFNDGIVIIDVAGGVSDARSFVLDPGSRGYSVDGALGPVIRKGLMAYGLTYDENAQHYALFGTLGSEAYQFQLLPNLALNAWRSATGTWFDRQADLRETLGESGRSKGVWLKVASESANRDFNVNTVAAGNDVRFDLATEQVSNTIMTGADMVNVGSGSNAFVFGAMLGATDSQTKFDKGETKTDVSGPTVGLYASYLAGDLFVDGMVNASFLNMTFDAPGLNLGEGVRLTQSLSMAGAQLESGWRSRIGDRLSLEPLATVSYVRTEFDDIQTNGATIAYTDKATSLRGGLGLRVGLDSTFRSFKLKYVATGRVWNEFEGENRMTLDLPGDGELIGMTDDFSGTFSELGLGLNLVSETGLVSAFVNGSYKSASDYDATAISAGVRLRW